MRKSYAVQDEIKSITLPLVRILV